MWEADKTKAELSLAPHEWKMLYETLDPILKNGAFSVRHFEGMILILLEKIKERYKH